MSGSRRLEQLAGPAVRGSVLHRQHRDPVGDQDEDEQGHRQRQHERGDLHADRSLDLAAHLGGDGLPEQLHAAGHAGRGDLGPQDERQHDDDDRGDRGGQDRVGVDGHAKPLGRGVVADLDRALGEDSFTHGVLNPSVLRLRWPMRKRPAPRLPLHCLRPCASSSTPAAPYSKRAKLGTTPGRTATPRPLGRKTNATVRPMTLMTSRRVAEFSAILRLSGWSSAVIESTDR